MQNKFTVQDHILKAIFRYQVIIFKTAIAFGDFQNTGRGELLRNHGECPYFSPYRI